MAEVRECSTCLDGDPLPGVKCCFNCARRPVKCEVIHRCGEDCPEWEEEKHTIADMIRSLSDSQLAYILCSTGWMMSEQKRCLEWLKQPIDGSIK